MEPVGVSNGNNVARAERLDRDPPRPTSDVTVGFEKQSAEAQSRTCKMELNMMRKGLMLVIAVVFATLGESFAWAEDADQAALIKPGRFPFPVTSTSKSPGLKASGLRIFTAG